MCLPNEIRSQLTMKFAVLFPHLDERQRRLLMAAEAGVLGHGGVRAVARAAGVSETTVRKGVFELQAGDELDNGTMSQARLAKEVWDYERYAGHRV